MVDDTPYALAESMGFRLVYVHYPLFLKGMKTGAWQRAAFNLKQILLALAAGVVTLADIEAFHNAPASFSHTHVRSRGHLRVVGAQVKADNRFDAFATERRLRALFKKTLLAETGIDVDPDLEAVFTAARHQIPSLIEFKANGLERQISANAPDVRPVVVPFAAPASSAPAVA